MMVPMVMKKMPAGAVLTLKRTMTMMMSRKLWKNWRKGFAFSPASWMAIPVTTQKEMIPMKFKPGLNPWLIFHSSSGKRDPSSP